MKKTLSLILAISAIGGFSANAQFEQLPGSSFENWEKCVPWTSNGNSKDKGLTPESWTIANVIGINGTGATVVGEKIAGPDGNAVCISNVSNAFVKSEILPGYITLGTSWNTAKGISASKKDGGTFGGISFTSRPEAIQFDYKGSNPTDPASVIVYSWRGSSVQKDVPGNVVLFGSPKKVTMADRDRNILGMGYAQGGEVSYNDFELVSKTIYRIDPASEWTTVTVPLTYVSESNPEKINVIFSAGDYFSEKPVMGSSVCIDNVRLIYDMARDGESDTSGITSVINENESSAAEYYTLQGHKISAEAMTPGIYIERKGNNSHKIMITNR